jgi:hypothetical protein
MSRMKDLIEHYYYNSKINCKLWCVGFGRKLLRNLFLSSVFKNVPYVTTHEFFCKNLRYISIKVAQGDLQKCITWPKNREKLSRIGKKMCQFKISPKEIQYSRQVNLFIFRFFLVYILSLNSCNALSFIYIYILQFC